MKTPGLNGDIPERSRKNPPPNEESRHRPLPRHGVVPLDELVTYAKDVLVRLAAARDLRTDDAGRPLYRLCSAGIDRECTWQMMEADFSGIGMATDMPLVLHAYADSPELEWRFGPAPIASTPRTSSPAEAAAVLDMDTLLVGFRRFVEADSLLFPNSATTNEAAKGRGPVSIEPQDCVCPDCGGALEVTGVDDVTMSVECEAGHTHELEHDAFDAGFDYVLAFLRRRGGAG